MKENNFFKILENNYGVYLDADNFVKEINHIKNNNNNKPVDIKYFDKNLYELALLQTLNVNRWLLRLNKINIMLDNYSGHLYYGFHSDDYKNKMKRIKQLKNILKGKKDKIKRKEPLSLAYNNKKKKKNDFKNNNKKYNNKIYKNRFKKNHR